MKKILALLLVFAMMLPMVACDAWNEFWNEFNKMECGLWNDPAENMVVFFVA